MYCKRSLNNTRIPPHIQFVSPQKKLSPQKKTKGVSGYRKRKREAIIQTQDLLKGEWRPSTQYKRAVVRVCVDDGAQKVWCAAKKKDDLADCLLQAVCGTQSQLMRLYKDR